jgi:starch synthase
MADALPAGCRRGTPQRVGGGVVRVLLLTREYPPHVYGGAGVHVEHLARDLARHAQVEVRCLGDQDAGSTNPRVKGYPFDDALLAGNASPAREALAAVLAGVKFVADPLDADLVHCHTWYAHWGGILARTAFGLPLVVTVHSLEPRRPWKRERLGGGYELSSWLERTALEMADAVIVVSESDRRDVTTLFRVPTERVHVIPNGIDADAWRRAPDAEALRRRGVDPTIPYVLFLGRITRQKGIGHFLRASARLPDGVQVVLCAASPDTTALEREVETAVESLRERRRVVWIREMVSHPIAVALYSGAAVFCCPSVYEPFGLINLEAMACETPVVATAVGGIPDVVVDGETGVLIPFDARPDGEPVDPERLADDLGAALTRVVGDADLARAMGRRGRERAVRRFGWDRMARRVLEVYGAVLERGPRVERT